ncbi:hypothetical protein MY3296_000499 [Beauveria thailandica]
MSHGINRQPPADAAHTQPPANVDDDDNDDAAIIEASRALEKKALPLLVTYFKPLVEQTVAYNKSIPSAMFYAGGPASISAILLAIVRFRLDKQILAAV